MYTACTSGTGKWPYLLSYGMPTLKAQAKFLICVAWTFKVDSLLHQGTPCAMNGLRVALCSTTLFFPRGDCDRVQPILLKLRGTSYKLCILVISTELIFCKRQCAEIPKRQSDRATNSPQTCLPAYRQKLTPSACLLERAQECSSSLTTTRMR
jgi:hypothetical protein